MEKIANILICIAGILWGVELIPQLWKTYKTKNVKGFSLALFIICSIAYLLYMIGNIILKNWVIVIAHIPSLIGWSLMSALVIKYRKK